MNTDDDFKAQTLKAITDQQNLNKQFLSRQLAFEAMMTAMLHRTQPEALAGLLDEYEQAVDRLATQLPPKFQQPQYWQTWSAEIEALLKLHRTEPK